jgi:hypothetical protein
MAGDPYPKSRQLARGERRYRRRIASQKQWQALHAAKGSSCRLADQVCTGPVGLHHLVSCSHGGDDIADNLVPLCTYHHTAVHVRMPTPSRLVLERLTDAEYAYMIARGGEDYPDRAYGLQYRR